MKNKNVKKETFLSQKKLTNKYTITNNTSNATLAMSPKYSLKL